MITYLGSLVRLCCGEGGILQTNIAGVWEVLAVYGPPWVCPSSQQRMLSGSTLIRLQGALRGIFKAGSMFHSLPMSKLLRFRFSGTQGTDLAERVFWALPRSKPLR